MILRSILMSITLLVATSGTASASDVLAAMNGNWTGKGWAKRTTNGPREAMRCRIKNSYIDVNRRLVVKGVCAVPGRKFKMNGTVSRQKENNRIKGRWSNPFGIGSTAVVGTEIDNSISLSFTARDPETRISSEQSMRWIPTQDGFNITTLLADNEKTQISNLIFKRR